MDANSAGRQAKALDQIHAVTYFAPEMREQLDAVGLDSSGMQYFASRSAAMGAVGASVVAASFYNFNPELVARFIPHAWAVAAPERIVAARYAGADATLRRILGAEHVGSPEMAEAAELAGIAARAARPEGRTLFAAHADTPWPQEPHLSLWHALTLLREYRGDGHSVALQAAGLSGLEALITHTVTGTGFTESHARASRGWSQEQWDDAAAGLRDRELLDAKGALTELGRETRQVVEDLTDDLALSAWAELGDDGLARLTELAAPLRQVILDSGTFPAKAFGPRWGKY